MLQHILNEGANSMCHPKMSLRKQFQVIVCIFFLTCVVGTQGTVHVRNFDNVLQNSLNSTSEFLSILTHLVERFVKDRIGSIDSIDNGNCLAALVAIKDGIIEKKDWALRFVDAQFKPPPGILEGRLHFLGDFDECIAINTVVTSRSLKCDNSTTCYLKGQYCSIALNTPMPVPAVFRAGVCLPTYCSNETITSVLQRVNETFGLPLTVLSCDNGEPKSLDARQIFIAILMSFILLCMAAGFAIDVYQRTINKTLAHLSCRALLSFSPYTNVLKIFHINQQSESLQCLHGLRFLSMCWVIIGHTYSMLNAPNMTNMNSLLDIVSSIPFQIIMNGTLSVDTFLFLGGLLVGYLTLTQLKKSNGKMNWFLFYFHRIWRLTPAYGLVMCLIFLWPLVGSGPQWEETTEMFARPCRKSWYATLFYFNNFIKDKSICMEHGWYLSIDMQFYLISPILLMLLYKYESRGLFANVITIATSCVVTWIIIFVKRIPVPATTAQAVLFDLNAVFFRNVYAVPWCRISPYCLGLCVGYLILNHYRVIRDRYLSDLRILIGGWLLAVLLASLSIFGARPWNRLDLPLDSTNLEYASTALFGATFRLGWSMAVAWVVIVCVHGYGGIVNRFLSWSPFIPLGRLTFAVYLIHPLIMFTGNGLQRTLFHFSHYLIFTQFLSNLMLSYMIAIPISLAFEAPFIGLEKLILGDVRKPKPRQETPSVNLTPVETI